MNARRIPKSTGAAQQPNGADAAGGQEDDVASPRGSFGAVRLPARGRVES